MSSEMPVSGSTVSVADITPIGGVPPEDNLEEKTDLLGGHPAAAPGPQAPIAEQDQVQLGDAPHSTRRDYRFWLIMVSLMASLCLCALDLVLTWRTLSSKKARLTCFCNW